MKCAVFHQNIVIWKKFQEKEPSCHKIDGETHTFHFPGETNHCHHSEWRRATCHTEKRDNLHSIRCINFVKCIWIDLSQCKRKQRMSSTRTPLLFRCSLYKFNAIVSLCNTSGEKNLSAVIKRHSKSLCHSVKSLCISRKWTKSWV